MRGNIFKKRLSKKIFSLLIIIFIIALSANQCFAKLDSSDINCYGFIVSPVNYKNITFQDQINCKMRNLINDLLREKIMVFWTAENITISVLKINNSEYENNISFSRGAYIIPLTDNDTQNIKLTTILLDYNQSNEIEEDKDIKIPVYILITQINLHCYPLSEVKIAQHTSPIIIGEICFLEISIECGFLDFEILNFNVIKNKLIYPTFNVFTHAGGGNYVSSLSPIIYPFYEDIIYKEAKSIREFVKNGGGYIGSCFGADRAASGYKFNNITFYLKKASYLPNLPTIGFYALADYISSPPPPYPNNYLGLIQVKIVNDTHPITYGLNNIVWDLHYGGSRINPIGKNIDVISQFYNTNTSMDETPSWVSSKFGKGKVVAFTNHPEILGWKNRKDNKQYIGKTVISNALFYTTAKKITTLQLSNIKKLSFIEYIYNNTVNISINIKPNIIFEDIKNSINETLNEITKFTDYTKQSLNLIKEIAKEKNVNLNDRQNATYIGNKSISAIIMYFRYFKKYLENTTLTLNIIENIYPILKNNTEFIIQLDSLKKDINNKISEIKNIFTLGYNLYIIYNESLFRYQHYPNLPKLFEYSITNKAHNLYLKIFSILLYLPQLYLNSLKFLRHSWYNYETCIFL